MNEDQREKYAAALEEVMQVAAADEWSRGASEERTRELESGIDMYARSYAGISDYDGFCKFLATAGTAAAGGLLVGYLWNDDAGLLAKIMLGAGFGILGSVFGGGLAASEARITHMYDMRKIKHIVEEKKREREIVPISEEDKALVYKRLSEVERRTIKKISRGEYF